MKNDYLDKAIAFATTKHSGQKRKDGSDYISHPLRVASYLKDKGYDQDYYLAGLFHDLLEDTDATEDEIFELSNQKVLDAVKLVTKSSFVPKDEYIKRILENQIAKESLFFRCLYHSPVLYGFKSKFLIKSMSILCQQDPT